MSVRQSSIRRPSAVAKGEGAQGQSAIGIQRAPSRPIDRPLFALLLALLVWAPLPFASNRPWALALLAAAMALLLACWLVLAFAGRVGIPPRVLPRARWPLVLLALMPLWALLQTLPLPREWVALLSPRADYLHAAALLAPGQWIPLSLDVAETRLYLLAGLVCWSAFALVLVLVNSPRRGRLLLWTLVTSGSFQAIYGTLMVLTGLEWGFLVEKYAGRGLATGTFVNRNHLAGYLVMCLAAGTGLLLSQLSRETLGNWRDTARRVLRAMLSTKVILRLLLAIMVIALVLTRSRMGNVAFFSALAVAGLLAMYLGRRFSPKLVLLVGSLFLVDALILGQWFGFERLVERLETAAPDTAYRLDVQAGSAHILRDFPLTGSGGGSYHSVSTYYKDPAVWGRYRHAHNDYLEIAADMGLAMLAVLGLFCLLVLRRALALQRPDHSRLQRGVGFAVVMVLVWVLLHSTIDFNLQIPANSMTLCVIFALAFASLTPEGRRAP